MEQTAFEITENRDYLINVLQDSMAFMREMQHETVAARVNNFVRHDPNLAVTSCTLGPEVLITYSRGRGDPLSASSRQATTFGRFVRRVTKIGVAELPDEILLKWSDIVNGRLMIHPDKLIENLKIVRGEGIVEAYCKEHGGYSCMTGPKQSGIIQFYADNPDRVELVLLPSFANECNGYARALLWKTDEGVKVLDRIYPNDGPHISALEQWAKQNGHAHRLHHYAPPNRGKVELSDGKIYTIRMKYRGYIPYGDTFHWGQLTGRHQLFLSNASKGMGYVLCSTGGILRELGPFAFCASCLVRLDEDAAIPIGDRHVCAECYATRTENCAHCNGKMVIHVDNRVRRSDGSEERWCETCRDHSATFCYGCNEIYLIGEMSIRSRSRIGNTYLCGNCRTIRLAQRKARAAELKRIKAQAFLQPPPN
jgi:hypothetical protein